MNTAAATLVLAVELDNPNWDSARPWTVSLEAAKKAATNGEWKVAGDHLRAAYAALGAEPPLFGEDPAARRDEYTEEDLDRASGYAFYRGDHPVQAEAGRWSSLGFDEGVKVLWAAKKEAAATLAAHGWPAN